MAHPTPNELTATILLALAILHTFSVSVFERWARRFPHESVRGRLFHFLGEVEIVFGLWAAVLILLMSIMNGAESAFGYMESLNFTEPFFVFAIMAVAATRPILNVARRLMLQVSRIFPIHREAAVYFSCLVVGPLLGSFITEPAAMTVTALLMRDRFFLPKVSDRFKYLTLAVLFVNVSIGGVLTPYAAPPVLMVARHWGWDLGFMLQNFGWKSALAVVLNAAGATALLYSEFKSQTSSQTPTTGHGTGTPAWLAAVHLLFLSLIVLTAHHLPIFVGIFLFFLGITTVSSEFQDRLKIRESLLVAFFLGGLVVLGGLQQWWLEPTLRNLNEFPLFLGATALTSITDNAALTYLGSQVEGISEGFKYALMAGAIAGGGLTVIANAPNPAGYTILRDRFGSTGIRPDKLFLFALPPTLIAMICLWCFQ